MDVSAVLQAAQSPDAATRQEAEKALYQLQQQNFAAYLELMSAELASEQKPVEVRKLAGLIVKNALGARDETRARENAAQWGLLDPALRTKVKLGVAQTLRSPVEPAAHTAAQVVAKIGAIELPRNEWAELIPSLQANMGEAATGLRQATLQTLGYLCEELSTESLQPQDVNNMLTAIVQGMRREEPDVNVRLAATTALHNALEFAHQNFERAAERDYIMQCTCEATLFPDARVRQAAFECLVAIADAYYDKLPAYIPDIFNITVKACREDEDSIALQAVEFWSTLCDEELELLSYEDGEAESVNHNFIKKGLDMLAPVLLETLLKQDEDAAEDEDAWNIAMAGGTCLGLVANVVEDDIVPRVMPFVQENVSSPEWRKREAATFAFGAILEGPSTQVLANLVQMAVPFMLRAMKDPNNAVKDSTAWTLSRIFEFLHGPGVEPEVITAQQLPSILGVMMESLAADKPHIADKVCMAIHNLAAGYEDYNGGESSPMSPFFQQLVQTLFAVSDRPDASITLRCTAYETLNELIRCSSKDVEPVVFQIIPAVIAKMNETFAIQVTSEDGREKVSQMQGLLCGTLQVITQKLGRSDNSAQFLQYADGMMETYLRVFQAQSSTVHEEAMLAVGALAFACGEGFEKYMHAFFPFIEVGLKNAAQYQVCAVTVGVVGDICRALEEKVKPWCDVIVYQLLSNLQSDELRMQVKPPILSCFGDIALAIGPLFTTYLPYVASMLISASKLSVETVKNTDEMIEYNNMLRVGIFEAYVGLINGFREDKSKIELLKQYADPILSFVQEVYNDSDRDAIVTVSAMGVMADLAETMDGVGSLFKQRPFYQEFVNEGLRSDDDASLVEAAERANKAIMKAVSVV